MLWEISKESWESVLRGLKKMKVKYLIFSALVFSPVQPWYTFNIIFMSLSLSLMMFFAIIGSVSIYYARNDLLTLVEIAHAYSFMVTLLVLLTFQYLKVPDMYQLLLSLDNDVFVYKTEHGREDDEKVKTTMRKYALIFQTSFHIALVAAISFAVVAPLLNNMIGDGVIRVRVAEINYNLPVPFWFPFNTKTWSGFTFAYFLLTAEICLVFFYVGIGLSFIVFFALEVGAQLKILHNSIMNIESRAIESYRSWRGLGSDNDVLGEDPLFHKCVRECLKENIQHHIEIIRFFNLFQNVTSNMLGLSIAAAMTFLACLSLVFTKVEPFSIEAVKFAFFFILELVFAFGFCFMGTSITEASKTIPETLYRSPWYKLLRSEEKKTLLIFQMNAAKKFVLKGGGMFVIDLQLFVQIARTTYSIFNIFYKKEG